MDTSFSSRGLCYHYYPTLMPFGVPLWTMLHTSGVTCHLSNTPAMQGLGTHSQACQGSRGPSGSLRTRTRPETGSTTRVPVLPSRAHAAWISGGIPFTGKPRQAFWGGPAQALSFLCFRQAGFQSREPPVRQALCEKLPQTRRPSVLTPPSPQERRLRAPERLQPAPACL